MCVIVVIAAAAVQDGVRVLVNALVLGRMRRRMPELFDGALALASIEMAIADYAKEMGW